MKKVYICSPLRGDIENNIKKANKYAKLVFSKGYLPLAPHAIFTQFLDDEIETERQAGLKMGLLILEVCDELWVFGKYFSEGMKIEIQRAEALGLKVRYQNLNLEEA